MVVRSFTVRRAADEFLPYSGLPSPPKHTTDKDVRRTAGKFLSAARLTTTFIDRIGLHGRKVGDREMRQSALQSFDGRGTQFQVGDEQCAKFAKFRENLQSGARDARSVKIDRPETRESCDRLQADVRDGTFRQE